MTTKREDNKHLRYAVQYVSDMGEPPEGCDAFEVYLVIKNEKKPTLIRVMTIEQLKAMRAANNTPANVTDIDFLFGDPQFRKFSQAIKCERLEFAYTKMGAKSEETDDQKRFEFSGNPFAPGTETKADTATTQSD